MNLTPLQVQEQGLPANPRTALLEQIKDKTIMAHGDQMPLTFDQLKRVRHLVYYCPECKAYHFWAGSDFEDVEFILGVPR